VLVGSPDPERVALVAAVAKDAGLIASDLIAGAARTVGGGGGKNAELAMAGGRDPARIDDALAEIRTALGLA
jgi:alanyl-tRNA synthetase